MNVFKTVAKGNMGLSVSLQVAFKGEIGLDAGGVTLEFFLTLFEEMVHPEYGLFMYCETTSPMWFPTNVSQHQLKLFWPKRPRACEL